MKPCPKCTGKFPTLIQLKFEYCAVHDTQFRIGWKVQRFMVFMTQGT